MINPTVEQELRRHLDALPPEQQRQVLEFARALVATRVRGVPGPSLIRFGGGIAAADLAVMTRAIEDEA